MTKHDSLVWAFSSVNAVGKFVDTWSDMDWSVKRTHRGDVTVPCVKSISAPCRGSLDICHNVRSTTHNKLSLVNLEAVWSQVFVVKAVFNKRKCVCVTQPHMWLWLLFLFLYKFGFIGFVYKIFEALPCGNFDRMHYLPNSKLGLIITPLQQDLFWCVCVRLIRKWEEYLGGPERFIILMNTIQRGTDTISG